RLPVVVGLVEGGAFGATVTFVPVAARAAGLAFAPFFVAYSATLILTRLVGGRIVDRPDRSRVLAPFLLVGAAALALVAVATGRLPLAVPGLLFGLAHGVLYPVMSALAIDLARPEHRGRAVGLFSLAFSAGANLLVMLYGLAADRWGYGAMFAAAAASLAAAAGYAARYSSSRGWSIWARWRRPE
ncbi:MAG TPA: MFS transporter, partial [Thermodesulfobacteriota bacterium]|nr:MFS transporter [Thermodesulfobacteriota bacterium]